MCIFIYFSPVIERYFSHRQKQTRKYLKCRNWWETGPFLKHLPHWNPLVARFIFGELNCGSMSELFPALSQLFHRYQRRSSFAMVWIWKCVNTRTLIMVTVQNKATINGMWVKIDKSKINDIFNNQPEITKRKVPVTRLILLICNEKSEWSHFCYSKRCVHTILTTN